MTSNHHASYALGYKRATMAITKRCNTVTWSQPQKDGPSSDCGLKPAHMKSDLLVIPNQHVGVNALALEADEGRDKQRYASVSSKYTLIRRFPNEGTQLR